MHRRRLLAFLGAGVPATLAGCLGGTNDTASDEPAPEIETDWPTGPYADYPTTTVTVRSDDGSVRGAVRAAVAETPPEREIGLSATDSMPAEGGMLYVHDSVGQRQYDMQDMDFGVDFVFADGEGTITAIRNAPAPAADETGTEQQYAGTAQYVLAVSYQWTDDNAVATGDRLDFEL